MSHKRAKIAALIEDCQGQTHDAHYLGYFQCFNHQLFYEAHDVLEELWLPQRHGPNGRFFKGLIQLAGAFVHLQKNRPGPSAALFRLAEANLREYPSPHEALDVVSVLGLIADWLRRLQEAGAASVLVHSQNAPQLALIASAACTGPRSC
jgi:predicted metal-dependent hydrolase